VRVLRRPLVGITLCYMLGLILGRVAPVDRGLLVALGLSALALYLGLHWHSSSPRQTALRAALLLMAVIAVGWARVGEPHQPSLDVVLPSRILKDWTVTLRGRVAADPVPERSNGGTGYRFPLSVTVVEHEDGTEQEVRGRVDVLWFGSLTYGASPSYGESWRMKGTLRDAPSWRRQQTRRLVTSNRDSALVYRGIAARIVHFCLAFRHHASDTLRIGVADHSEAVGLVQALLLGYRSELSREAHRLFVHTGTLHIFAISGLHVGIVVGLILFALSACSIPRPRWLWFVAPLLIAYTLMTGMKPSAVRACIMAIVFLSASALHRRADSYSAVAFAALAILACCPDTLTEASFTLSFTVVTGILLIFPHIDRRLQLLWAPDPWQLERESLMLRVGRVCGRRLTTVAAVSLSAWLVSAPLIALCFGRMAPVALLANVWVVPMAFLIVLAGALSIVTGSVAAFGADVFNHAALALTHIMLAGLKLLVMIPGGFLKVPDTSLWIVACWYGVLGMVLLYLYARHEAPVPDWLDEE